MGGEVEAGAGEARVAAERAEGGRVAVGRARAVAEKVRVAAARGAHSLPR